MALGVGIPFPPLANVINSMSVLAAAASFSVFVVSFCSIYLFLTVVCRFLVASCYWIGCCANNLAFSLFSFFSSSKSLILCAMLAYPIDFLVARLFGIFWISVMKWIFNSSHCSWIVSSFSFQSLVSFSNLACFSNAQTV